MIRVARTVLLASLLISGNAIAQDFTVDPSIAGDRERLRAIQTNLNAIGIDVGRPDGVFGRGSTAGMLRFLDQFRPGEPYVLDASVEELLAKVTVSYTGDPWENSSDYGGLTGAFVESVWDASDHIPLCVERKCQAIPSLLAIGDLTGDGLHEVVSP